LTPDDQSYLNDAVTGLRASAFVSLFMGPLQGGIAAFAVETAFLMLGRMAFMMHTINVMMGKCDE